MTDSTPHFALPLLLASQADKHVTLNEALLKLDQLLHLTVLSSTIAIQPAAPIPNARYILPTNATGPVWSSLPRQSVAVWDGEAWSCLTPKLGWIAYIEDLAELHIFRNGNWLETVATLDCLASTPRVWNQQATFVGGAEPIRLKGTTANLGIAFQSQNTSRWYLYHGNSGATFNLNRYDSAGNYIGTPFSIAANGALQTEFCTVFHGGAAPEPANDSAFALGSPSRRFSSLFATTGAINTSDAREKVHFQAIGAPELDAARAILRAIGSFQWRESVKVKGRKKARRHIGVTAQSVRSALVSAGLAPEDWALFCKDLVSDSADTGKQTQTRYGLRLDQVILLAITGLLSDLDRVKEKLDRALASVE
ncbi:DUF2793 domain-containing protein [Aquidulcibacter sp.]|uniref:DUF2793 domain-containing protein n=1 Tax=Aquidulcibacter sp. TaxID=2052990 RepID=UPI0025B9DBFE|nr:DUF2793 domain-containing protein [Aquidulcibacter sp.]MCA3695824.1 DUF2793 domain-containing protein [Aquidulcibacter sp.]